MTSAVRAIGGPGGAPSRAARWRRKNLTVDRVSFAVVFLGLPLALYVALVLSPFAQAVVYSLTRWTGFDASMTFVGIANYARAFADDTFLIAVRNSVILVVVLPIVVIGVALTLATMVTVGGPSSGPVRGVRGGEFYRIVLFFPYIIPAIAAGIMWGQIYDPSNGLLNGLLTSVGLRGFASFPWLGDTRTAMLATMLVMAWTVVGFYTVIFVAAIKALPAELYEAARLDGAGRLRTAVTITVPMLRGSIRTSVIYMGIFALDAFVFVSALNSGGGPDNATLVIAQELFRQAFTKGQFGYACALGVVLAAITLVFAGVVFLVDRVTGGDDAVQE